MSHQKALLVPSTAILRDNNMDFVFKAMGPLNVEGHTSGVDIQKMKVTIAGDRLGMTAVVEGLGNGDHIVSDGALLLNAALANSGK